MTTQNPILASPYARRLTSQICVVQEMRQNANETDLRLEDGSSLKLPPFLYVRVGDRLEIQARGNEVTSVHKLVAFAPEGNMPKVQLYPPYKATETIELPPHVLTVTFRERCSEKDWRSAKILEQFHYRGRGLNRLVGRRTVLLADAEDIGVIGYGVLSATVAAAKPRFDLFQTNFTLQMRSKLINKIARIPRVVVHPEFRGLGIGARLARHLVIYAKEHWDINGYKPVMIEVIASMTEYHTFFQQAGFIEAGSTLGRRKGVVPAYGSGSWEPRPNHSTYKFFSHQKPKPYLLYPLSEEVMNMLKENDLLRETQKRPARRAPQLKTPVRFHRVFVTYKARNRLTPRAEEVKDAFGVDSEHMYSPILNGFSLTIRPGDVVLFTGASGSGKSTVIKLLTESAVGIGDTMEVSGTIEGVDPSQIAKLDASRGENLPLIEHVGESTKEAIAILNSVGLAEAHLYLKRCSQISEGQKYRFAVAKLCDSKKPIWVADEFASTLDPQTAAIVAKGLRKLALQHGATVILAAPHISHFVASLLPNKVVHLRWGGLASIYSAKLCRTWRNEGIEVWAKNNGRKELSRVLISGLLEAGVQEPLLEIGRLSTGESTPRILVELSRLQSYSALVLFCAEGVGGIIKLE